MFSLFVSLTSQIGKKRENILSRNLPEK